MLLKIGRYALKGYQAFDTYLPKIKIVPFCVPQVRIVSSLRTPQIKNSTQMKLHLGVFLILPTPVGS
jgi:hypothetical protein